MSKNLFKNYDDKNFSNNNEENLPRTENINIHIIKKKKRKRISVFLICLVERGKMIIKYCRVEDRMFAF